MSKTKRETASRADTYLDGTYELGKKAKKKAAKGITAAVLVLSLLSGIAFSSASEINEDQAGASFTPTPVVMDASDFMNSSVDDEEDDAEEEQETKMGVMARFRQAVLSLPQSVRLLIVTPLWLIGTAIMTLISFLWTVIFASPIGAFIASFAIGLAVLLGLFTATAKILFPDVPVSKILCKRNILILCGLALLLSALDAVAPMYWRAYPMAAALLKLVLGGTVIGVLAVRTKNLFNKLPSLA